MTAKEMVHVGESGLALTGKALEDFVVRGNLAALSPADKAAHYIQLCNSLGLNPATKPFEYITLQGKETLYARRDCTDQLRKVHNVSIEIVTREHAGDVYIVTARAQLPNGRRDESTGAVPVGGLKGEALSNALMKCETKAKRRVTLSICGLGMLDESETESIGRFDNLPREVPQAQQVTNVVTIEPKREKTKPGEALPEVPKTVTTLPASLLLANKPLQGLDGVPLQEMDEDDLNLVIDTIGKFHEKRKATNTLSSRGLEWLVAIIATAKDVLAERSGPAPEEVPQ